jgi:hypothetical protein
MTIDQQTSGNVGIGTSAPDTALNIVKSPMASQLRLQDVVTNSTAKLGALTFAHYTNAEEPVAGIWASNGSSANELVIGGGSSVFNAASSINFFTAATNTTVTGSRRMVITAGGLVGIGTSSPNHSLHVDGGSASTIAEFVSDTSDAAVIKLTNENSTAQSWGLGVAGTGHAVADNAYYIRDETGGSNDFVITTAGNIGIGEPAPVHKLSLRSTPFIHLGYNGTSAATEMGGIKANSYDVENTGYSAAEVGFITGTTGYYGAIQFRTNNNNSTTSRAAVRMTIDQSGNVIIGAGAGASEGNIICGPGSGTTAGYNDSSYPLTVAYTGSSHQAAAFYDSVTDSSSREAVWFRRYPSSSWATVGSISTTDSATAYSTSSDYRLKENEQPFGDALDLLRQLKPYCFNFKIHDPSVISHGFFAHEAAEIVPQAVMGEKDEVDDEGSMVAQSIDHSHMVPLLTAAIQALAAKVEALESL